MTEFFIERFNYWAIVLLMMCGLFIVFSTSNTIKKLIGLGLFQTAVFLFYITLGKVQGGTGPILFGKDKPYHGEGHDHAPGYGIPRMEKAIPGQAEPVVAPDMHVDGAHHSHGALMDGDGHALPADAIVPEAGHLAVPDGTLENLYSNPLPHVLILTAIVVGVATLAVGLSLVVRIREAYGTIEDDEIRIADCADADADASEEAARA
jgi:multicomponent Na+:H+ antiporter subunit C